MHVLPLDQISVYELSSSKMGWNFIRLYGILRLCAYVKSVVLFAVALTLFSSVIDARHFSVVDDVDNAVNVSCTGAASASSSAPYFTVEPRSSVVRRGDRVLLYCAASSTASPPSDAESVTGEPARSDVSITWTHNGTTLRSQSEWSSSSRVDIASFGRSDQGLYQCIANNSLGAVISRPAALQLAGNISVASGHAGSV